MMAADRIFSPQRVCESKVNFFVPRPGDFEWTVYAMCDSYAGLKRICELWRAGLDVSCPVRFKASKRSEVDRSVFVHPEDAEIKTLFEELMMGLDQEQESDSEEEDGKEDGKEEAPAEPEKVVEGRSNGLYATWMLRF